MEDTQLAGGNGGGGLKGVDAPAGRFATDQPDALILDEVVKASDGVGAAAHTGDDRIGQATFFFQNLCLDLPGNDCLKIPYHGGERMGSHHRAETIVGVINPAGPLPHGLRDGVFEGGSAGFDRDHLSPQQTHPVDVEGLADGVLFAHKDNAFHSHEGSCGGRRNPVLARAGLSNQAGFPHLLGQQGLAQDVVDLVCAGMVQIFPLEINLGAAQVTGHFRGIVEAGRPAGVIIQKGGQFRIEIWVVFIKIVGFLQLDDCVHQGFGDILPAMYAEASVGIGHGSSSFLTAAAKAAIFSRSFAPFVSMPELTSTP